MQHRRGQWQYRTQDIVDSSQENSGKTGQRRTCQGRAMQETAGLGKAGQGIPADPKGGQGIMGQGRAGQDRAELGITAD